MVCSMAKATRHGKIVLSTLVNLLKAKKRAAASTFGKINPNTQASGTKIRYTGWVHTSGETEDHIPANGKTSR